MLFIWISWGNLPIIPLFFDTHNGSNVSLNIKTECVVRSRSNVFRGICSVLRSLLAASLLPFISNYSYSPLIKPLQDEVSRSEEEDEMSNSYYSDSESDFDYA